MIKVDVYLHAVACQHESTSYDHAFFRNSGYLPLYRASSYTIVIRTLAVVGYFIKSTLWISAHSRTYIFSVGDRHHSSHRSWFKSVHAQPKRFPHWNLSMYNLVGITRISCHLLVFAYNHRVYKFRAYMKFILSTSKCLSRNVSR